MLTIEKEIDDVVKLRDVEKKTFEQIGDELNLSESTVRRRYKARLIERVVNDGSEEVDLKEEDRAPEIIIKSHVIPNGKHTPARFKPMVCEGDAMVIADLHIPLHDPDFLNCMIECAKRNKIKQLIIAGDYWNMDSFSSYLPHQEEAEWQIERYDGNYIMKVFAQIFDEIWFIWGNHDFRLTKATGFKESFTACMKWALNGLTEQEYAKINFSDLDYMYYYPTGQGGLKFRVCHPQNFSKVPLTVPRELAVKYSCSIISAHSHHCSKGVASNGKDVIMEAGGFFAKDRTEYIQRTNTSHEWVQAFAMFKEGLIEQISPVFGNDLQYRKEVKNVKAHKSSKKTGR